MMNRDDFYSEETPRSGMPPTDDLPEFAPDDVTPVRPMSPVEDWEQMPARPLRPVQEPPRRSKARERIEKRKQHAVQSSSGTKTRPSLPRQISVPSSLPKIDFRIGRGTLYVIGSVVLVVAVISFLGLLRNQTPEVLPNALWIGTEWTYDAYTDDQLKALVQRLRDNKIGTIYAWVSYLQDDGTWRQETTGAWDNVKVFRQRLKALYPEIEIFGWLSLNVNLGDGYRLDDAEIVDSVVSLSGRVITEFSFDGVYLNVEPVWDDDQNFLDLLRKVRAQVGTAVPIAAAIPPDWSPLGVDFTIPAIIQPGTVWNREYKKSVALLVDQLLVMSYNSTLGAPADYSRWVAYQVQSYAAALAESSIDTEIIIGIPTYDAELPGHDPLIETVPAALDGIKLGIEQAGEAARFVRGAAIYAEWTTDETEWSQFKREWVD